MKNLHRILSILLTTFFLAWPVWAEDIENNLHNIGLVDPVKTVFHMGGGGLWPKSRKTSVKSNNDLEISIGGGGLYPPRPKSIESKQYCSMGYCLPL